ncbi:MAG: PD-(D/E)XK nuclease family protein [Arenicellales bacterium]|nr:PD-(D/E)XK nuclease family protein [Arenicellales bacterium]
MHHVFEQLANGAFAVTSTRRLSHYLLEQYADFQSGRGLKAWNTPRAATWEEWIIGEWGRLARIHPALGEMVVLDDQQETQVWERVIQQFMEQGSNYGLLQTSATARAAKDTWRLIHDWQIPLERLENTHVEDTQAFYEWAIQFTKHMEINGWLSICQVSTLLQKQVESKCWLPTYNVLFIGFDNWLPNQESLIRALKAADVGFDKVAPPTVNQHKEVISCIDRPREFETAAHWAKQLLNKGTIGPIGIIVDGLERYRDQIDIIFDQELHSKQSLSFDDDRRRAFHISLGRPLAEYPVVDAALTLLGFVSGAKPLQDVTRLLHTPFISGGATELFARASVDLRLRQLGWNQVSLAGLLRLIEKSHLPASDLVRCLNEALRLKPKGRANPSEWARVFVQWLSIFGWPGERTSSSSEYQTVQAWRELLSRFARLNIVTPRLSSGEALARIKQMAQRRVFQPRREVAPVQIMGVLEASGMQFSHLWVTGMSDEAWPPPLRLNPFLPYELQRRFGLPGSIAEYELEKAQTVARRLIDSAEYVVVSFPRQSDEQVLQLSPVYRDLPVSSRSTEYVGLPQFIQKSAPSLEAIDDSKGPALGSGSVRGGAAIFKDQAACPFRAFAHHRLAATAMPDVEPGLNPADRGILVHATLAGIWRELKTRDKLQTLAEVELELILQRHIDRVVNEFAQKDNSRFRQAILDIERQRLRELLEEWLSVESNRNWFEVEEVEQKINVNFRGVDLGLRIDRIDKLGVGQRAIIDYKTGRNVQIDQWSGDRPDDPQLPLYFLCVDKEISALAFAHLRKGHSAFKGISKTEGFVKGMYKQEDWTELTTQWEQALSALAEQFRSGSAVVAPKDSKTCQTCDVISLCRIFGQHESAR